MTSTAMGSNDASHLFVYLLEFFHKENSFALPIYLFNYLLISIWTHGDLFYSLVAVRYYFIMRAVLTPS